MHRQLAEAKPSPTTALKLNGTAAAPWCNTIAFAQNPVMVTVRSRMQGTPKPCSKHVLLKALPRKMMSFAQCRPPRLPRTD